MIKSTSAIKQPEVSYYPKLRVANNPSMGHVVLFTEPSVGMVVHPSSAYKTGYYTERWDANSFTDYHGDIILQNG